MMALEKTRTPGIYKFIGKRGKVKYRLLVNVQVTDPLSPSEHRWKLKVQTFGKEQDARDAKLKIQNEVRSGSYAEPSELTVKGLVEEWLHAGKTRGVSKKGRPWKIQTYISHKIQFDRYIAPQLGDLKASKLKKAAIEQAAGIWAQSVSAETTNKLLGTLSAAYKFGLKNRDSFGIRENPLEQVERFATGTAPETLEELAFGEIADHGEDEPKAKPGTLRAIRPDEVFTASELRKIFEAAEPGLERSWVMTMGLLGVRHGEGSALRRITINLKRGALKVNRSLTWLKGGPTLERPKTRAAYRELEMPAELIAELRRWMMAAPPNPNGLIFVDALGRPIGRKKNNDTLKSICQRAGVRPLNVNNLRHTFASLHLINGAPLLEVSKMMGHAKPSTTLEIYSHWTTNEKSRSQAKLANLIFSAPEQAAGAENQTV
jgi:integrase